MCLLPNTGFPFPNRRGRSLLAHFPMVRYVYESPMNFGEIYVDEQFAGLFPQRGLPAEAPALLALVTLFQFAENLSDRQAADAACGRIDWKYALGLEL